MPAWRAAVFAEAEKLSQRVAKGRQHFILFCLMGRTIIPILIVFSCSILAFALLPNRL